MPQTINVPGVGQLQFPDGMSQQDMASAIQRNFPQIHAPQSDLAAQGTRIMGDIDQANREQGKVIIGAGETALNLATGMGSTIVGGLRGLGTLATGGSMEDAAQAIEATQHDFTYKPRTGIGKLGSELATVPLTAAKAGVGMLGGSIGGAINGEQGRIAGEAIGNVLPDVAMTLVGGRAALRGARPAAQAPVTPPTPEPYYTPTYQPPKPLTAPELPPATPAAPASALDAYAAHPPAAPYGNLHEPAPLPSGAPQSALEQYAADAGRASSGAPPMQPIEAGLRVPESTPKLPASNTSALAAAAADTSDIQAVLDQFGIKLQGKEPAAPAGGGGQPPAPPAPPGGGGLGEVPRDPNQRQQVLVNVGLTRMRKSALEGNEASAATDYQLSKYTSEPAGMAALDQFAHERDTLAAHAQGMIDRTGAVSGLDEASLQAKGRELANPIDAAREHFEQAKRALYDIADKRAAANGTPVGTGTIDALLADPDFQATLMAKDQQGLLHTIQSQYGRFKALDPEGKLTMTNAERYRKWLNAVWSPDKSQTLAQVKAALDHDVFQSAGADVYQSARQLHMQEKKIFEDPKGIAKLFDADPYTPINRSTAYHKIPDAIINLSPEQFAHIVETYKNLPQALQPAAQKALATLRAHYGDKLLSAGTETGHGNARALWNRGGINQIVRNNSAKLPLVFGPEELAQIGDMVDAGNILAVNATYPGASAQAAQALKRGMMSRIGGKAVTAVGGGAGAMFGPAGAAAGAMLGDVVGTKAFDHIGERKALAHFKKGIIDAARGDQ